MLRDQKSPPPTSSIIRFIINYIVFNNIGISAVEYYLDNDRLSFSCHFWIGMLALIPCFFIDYIARDESGKFKTALTILVILGILSFVYIMK